MLSPITGAPYAPTATWGMSASQGRQQAEPAAGESVRARADSAETPVGRAGEKQGKGLLNATQKQEKGIPGRMEDVECETCASRKYQDGSDDPGVSFKTPTKLSPEAARSAVRAHENEHVTREQAKAQREDREVVSQSVTLHTGICSECGKMYVSGGMTRTVTKGAEESARDSRFDAGRAQTEEGAFLNAHI